MISLIFTYLSSLQEQHRQFYKKTPLFLLGCTLLVGALSTFTHAPWIYITLWIFYLIFLCSFVQIVLLSLMLLYCAYLLPASNTPTPVQTQGLFTIQTIDPYETPFQKKRIRYTGSLLIGSKRLTCTVFDHKQTPRTSQHTYLIEGTFIDKSPATSLFFSKQWTPVASCYSLADLRYRCKVALKKFLFSHLDLSPTELLCSLMTGDHPPRKLRYDFAKLGMQHILAISGFHFGLCGLFFSWLFRCFLTLPYQRIALMIGFFAYFLFVGDSPSVQRSFIMAELYLLAFLLFRQSHPLNLIGCAMTYELLVSPAVCLHVGFQLSFASCVGIFLFYRPLLKVIGIFFRVRSPSEKKDFSLFEKHVYLIGLFFKNSLSITLAVQLLILPILLFHFHTFPWLSLLYNLFFPLGVTLACFTFFLESLLFCFYHPFPFVLTNYFFQWLIDLISYPPQVLNYFWTVPSLPIEIVIGYLGAILSIGIFVSVPLASVKPWAAKDAPSLA